MLEAKYSAEIVITHRYDDGKIDYYIQKEKGNREDLKKESICELEKWAKNSLDENPKKPILVKIKKYDSIFGNGKSFTVIGNTLVIQKNRLINLINFH